METDASIMKTMTKQGGDGFVFSATGEVKER